VRSIDTVADLIKGIPLEVAERPAGLRYRARNSARSLTGRIAFDRYSEVPG
jgi:hypothetical protein